MAQKLLEGTGQTQNTQDTLMFFSFLKCSTRNSKSFSNDSGISKDKMNLDHDGIIVISDDEAADEEPHLELLCEVEFETGRAVPLPMEHKLQLKTEQEGIQETLMQNNTVIAHKSIDFTNVYDALHQTNVSAPEKELLPLAKFEPNMNLSDKSVASSNCDTLSNDNYIQFICPKCNDEFPSSNIWREHMNEIHKFNDPHTFNFTQRPNNEFECNQCQAIITRCTNKTLQQHYLLHLPFKSYRCKMCNYEARSFYLMVSHIMLHKDREELSLNVAPTTQQKSVVLEQACRCLMTFICPVCGDSFETEEYWQAHINFKHNFLEKTAENRYNDHFKCSECSVEIFSQHISDLQQHLFTHFPNKAYLKCKVCNWTVSRTNFMVSHILHLHKEQLNAATGSFISNDSFEINSNQKAIKSKRDHSTPIPKLPSVSVASNNDLSNDDCEIVENHSSSHILVNNKTNNNNATTDGIKTRSSINTRSFNINTSNKRSIKYISYIEDNASNSSIELYDQRNDNSLNGSKKGKYVKTGFKCVGCRRSFPTATERNAHNIATHPKYKCTSCQKPFALKNELKNHHCAQPFQCNICFREFNFESFYQNHMLLHQSSTNSTRPYKKNNDADPDYV